MKVIRLQAENVKRLRCIDISPKGNVVHITGDNAQGKSSVLDSLYYAIAGKKAAPSQPVRHGEETATIKVDLGELKITRKFTAAGSTSLIVEAADGSRFASPQSVLDQLTANLSFDPLAFTRMPAKEQLDTLKKLVRLDIDLDALDRANAEDYEARAAVNREAKQLEGQLSVMPEIDRKFLASSPLPLTLIDESKLLKEFQDAANANVVAEREINARKSRRAGIDQTLRRVAELRAQADQLEHEANEAAKEFAALPPPPPTIDLNRLKLEIDNAKALNLVIRKHQEREAVVQKLGEVVGESDRLTQAMAARAKEKAEAIARAEMPIKGLAFGEGEVVFNGVPFSQASSAEQLCVSTVIAMALNPRLRVIRLQDGSLLDERSMALIEKLAEKGSYQIWCECLSSSDPCQIHLVDGEVVSQPLAKEA